MFLYYTYKEIHMDTLTLNIIKAVDSHVHRPSDQTHIALCEALLTWTVNRELARVMVDVEATTYTDDELDLAMVIGKRLSEDLACL